MLPAGLQRYTPASMRILLTCCTLLSCPQALRTQQSPTHARPASFDVVSIHRSRPGSNASTTWGISPVGYRAEGQSLWDTLMVAYFPEGMGYWTPERLVNAPPWLDEQYDIDARVAESDLPAWQAQGPTLKQKPMLQHMLQSMLVDRCHLIAHLEPGLEMAGYTLLLAKGGPHLKPTVPGETLPKAVSLEEGGILVPWVPGGPKQLRFYNTSMAELARFFSRSGPLQDGTHLSGRYDFVLNGLDNPDQLGPASAADPESRNPFADWDLAPLGLEVKRAKFPVSRLVIEHMDRPTPN